MNLTTLQTNVYDALGVDSGDGLLTPTVVTDAINAGLKAISLDSLWPWLQSSEILSVVAGTDTYTPSATWRETDEIRDDTARVLERYSMRELDDRWNLQTQGKPREFAVYGEQIVIRPVPDAAYTLTHRFYRFEPPLVSGSDTPLLPDYWTQAVVEYATWVCLRRAREISRAQQAQIAWQDWQKRMAHGGKRRTDTPGRIRVRPGGFI